MRSRSTAVLPPWVTVPSVGGMARIIVARTGLRSLVILLLVSLFVIDVTSMQRMSITADEPSHYRYGFQILDLNARRFDDSKMPFSALNALPRKLAPMFPPGKVQDRLARLETGRYATVLAALVFALVVFRWAADLYGPSAGVFALFLFTFDPNIIAHSRFVTTDLYGTGMMTLALYCFWRFLNGGGWSRAWASALSLGAAQLAKYTCAYLLAIFPLIALGYYGPDLWRAARAGRGRELIGRLLRFAGFAMFFLAVVVAVVNIGFLGQDTGRPLQQYKFKSEPFRAVQAALDPVGWLPVPTPYAFLEGLDWVLERDQRSSRNVYLLGQLSSDTPSRRFPSYYLYAWLYKIPLGTQLFALAAVVAYVARFRRFRFRRDEWFLWCPLLFFAAYFIFVFRTQTGIRFSLVMFPMLYIFSSSLLAEPNRLGRRHCIAIAVVALYVVVSVLSYFPFFVPYMNELMWDRKFGYTILVDDMGESEWYLRRYLKRHPEAIVAPERPMTGTLIFSVTYVAGFLHRERFRRFDWIRANGLRPVDHVAYSYLVFRVTQEDLDRIEPRRN